LKSPATTTIIPNRITQIAHNCFENWDDHWIHANRNGSSIHYPATRGSSDRRILRIYILILDLSISKQIRMIFNRFIDRQSGPKQPPSLCCLRILSLLFLAINSDFNWFGFWISILRWNFSWCQTHIEVSNGFWCDRSKNPTM
jgi:hypothetical protein